MTPRLKALLAAFCLLAAVGIWRLSTRPRPGPGGTAYQAAVEASGAGDGRRALALLAQAVTAEPGNAEYHAELGTEYLRQGLHDHAVAALEAAAFLNPALPHVFCRLAQGLVEQRRREDALAALETALRSTPNCAHALTVRGEQLLRDDNLKAALADFQRAAELDPGSTLAHHKAGFILLQTQQYAAARQALEAALRTSPNHPGLHFLMGEAYLGLGGDSAAQGVAEQHLRAALVNNPEAPRARAALGQLYLRRSDLSAARGEFEAALAAQPRLREARFGLAQVAQREGQTREAERHQWYVRQSQERDARISELAARAAARPGEPGPGLLLARACLEAGALKEAERALGTLVAANPGLREARELRARVYEEQNQPERAAREAALAARLPRAERP